MSALEPMSPDPDESGDFALRFTGEENEIDVQTLVGSLLSITELVEETAAEIVPGAPVTLRVRATKPGSFVVDLSITPAQAVMMAQRLFTSDAFTATKGIVTVVGGLF